MRFTDEQNAQLSAQLSRAHVKQRPQAGRSLSYIEGWHAISEANRIFGFDGWNRETLELRELGEPRLVDGKWRVAYLARVRITVFAGDHVARTIREGCGYGSGIDKDPGQAHESALKESETDAMKRALMTFGNPFGLALYDKEQAHVADERPVPQASQQSVNVDDFDAARAEKRNRLHDAARAKCRVSRDAWLSWRELLTLPQREAVDEIAEDLESILNERAVARGESA